MSTAYESPGGPARSSAPARRWSRRPATWWPGAARPDRRGGRRRGLGVAHDGLPLLPHAEVPPRRGAPGDRGDAPRPEDAGDDPEARLLGRRPGVHRDGRGHRAAAAHDAAAVAGTGPVGRPLPLRQGRAIGWFEEALAPLRPQLGPAGVRRLAIAVRSAVGIESLVWLTDVAGCPPRPPSGCWTAACVALADADGLLSRLTPREMTSTESSSAVIDSAAISSLARGGERHGVGRAERRGVGDRDVEVVDEARHPAGLGRRPRGHLVDGVVVLVLREAEVRDRQVLAERPGRGAPGRRGPAPRTPARRSRMLVSHTWPAASSSCIALVDATRDQGGGRAGPGRTGVGRGDEQHQAERQPAQRPGCHGSSGGGWRPGAG